MARWKRAAIIVISASLAGYLGFVLWGWGVPVWLLAFVALVLLVVAARRGSRRRSRSRSAPPSGELHASDAYSDLQLGRMPPTHPHHDPAPTSQIDDPPRAHPGNTPR